MSTWTQTDALTTAQLVGTLAALDADTEPAYATIFDASDVALVDIVFAQPAGTIADAELTFEQGDPTGDLIATGGTADHFQLFNGAGTLLGTGTVTDAAGDGIMKLAGTTGTLLFAGGRALLASFKMV